jgi:two-component system phosphate regulon sensor histidine kinase PhoR
VVENISGKTLDNIENLRRESDCLSSLAGARITIILPDGTVLEDSDKDPKQMNNHADRPEIAEAFKGGIGESTRFSDTLKKRLKYIAVPLRSNGTITAVVRLSQPIAEIHWTQHIIIRQIILGTATAALFFAIVALYLSRQITKPLEEMRQITEELADGNLDAHVNAASRDEIGALAQAINKMAEQLNTRIKTIVRQRVEQNAMLTCMKEGVLAIDQDDRILYLNSTAAKLLSTTPEKAKGCSIEETVRHHELQAFITEALSKRDTNQAEITLKSEAYECHVQLHRTPLTDPTGWNIGALIVMNDITDIKRLETMRSDFVANVSHELKTPITALKGCVETLSGDTPPPPEDSAGFIAMMSRHVQRLEAIVEDLLNLSRIEFEMNDNRIEFKQESVCKVLEHSARTFSERIKEKNITLDITCREPLTASINEALLEQAISNLIDNAIKYSEKGTGIYISAKLPDDQIIIMISDQGCGIDEQHLPRIFERFYRVDKARSRAVGGTGLGLAIVKHIILAHRGNISVKSELGKGSTFTIHIPNP